MSSKVTSVKVGIKYTVAKVETPLLLKAEHTVGYHGTKDLFMSLMPPGTTLLDATSLPSGEHRLELRIAGPGRTHDAELLLSQALEIHDVAIERGPRGDVLDVDKGSYPHGPSQTLIACIENEYPCVPRFAERLHVHWDVEYRRYINDLKHPVFGPCYSDYALWRREIIKRFTRRQVLMEVTEALSLGDVPRASESLRRLA